MRFVVLGLCSAFCLAAAPDARALDAEDSALTTRVVEICVAGDANARFLAQAVATELFGRLRVQVRVRAEEGAAVASGPVSKPWLTAHLDFRVPCKPAVRIEQERAEPRLPAQVIPDVTSLETGVEAALHVVYSAAEAALSLPEQVQDSQTEPAPEQAKPLPARPLSASAPRPPASREPSPPSGLKLGLDLGALGRIVSFGGPHVLAGAGVIGELRADWSRLHAGLLLFGALHETTEVPFGDGYSTLRPFSLRLIPTIDARLTGRVHGSFGLGVGLDEFTARVSRPPSPPPMPMPGPIFIENRSAVSLDPLISALVGVRVPSGSRTFVSLLGSLDFGLGPSSLEVGRVGPMTSVFALPDVRASLVLAPSFSSAGAPRFSPARASSGTTVTE